MVLVFSPVFKKMLAYAYLCAGRRGTTSPKKVGEGYAVYPRSRAMLPVEGTTGGSERTKHSY